MITRRGDNMSGIMNIITIISAALMTVLVLLQSRGASSERVLALRESCLRLVAALKNPSMKQQ